MIFKCDKCNYTTKRLLNLQRHEARKKPCVAVPCSTIASTGSRLNTETDSDTCTTSETDEVQDNLCVEFYLKCSKCFKQFSRKDNMKVHEKKCDGSHTLQCNICLKMFATQQGKWKHIQYVKCNPPTREAQITNITNNNITNNITTTNNINIRVDFGQESLKHLWADTNYQRIMSEHIKLGKYAIPKSIEEIYFNDKFPENQTLKKERKNDKMVSVQYNGKWETRLFDDICKDMVKKTEEYHDEYFKNLREKYNIGTQSKEFKRMMVPLRQFAHQMLWYGWSCNEIENLGLELNEPDDSDESKRRQRIMNKLIINKIYEHSE